jgi:cytochrome b561
MLKRISAWARTHTARGRYTPVGQAFHWGMAAIIVGLLGLGWYMGQIPSGGGKQAAFELHMVIGFTTLFLSLLRLGWRLTVPGPVNDADKLGLQTLLSKITHWIFYVCFVGLPLSGWIMWSAFTENGHVVIAGPIALNALPFEALGFSDQRLILRAANLVHEALVVVLLAIIPLHVGAALKHHFWDRHDVLTGMLPILPGDASRGVKRHKSKKPRSRIRSAKG